MLVIEFERPKHLADAILISAFIVMLFFPFVLHVIRVGRLVFLMLFFCFKGFFDFAFRFEIENALEFRQIC